MRIFIATALLIIFAVPTDSVAQRTSGSLGFGAQFGSPSGFSLNMYQAGGMSYDFLAAWDLDHFFFLNGHGIFERPLGNSPNVRLQYGPGLFVGFYDDGPNKDDTVAGISATLGLSLMPNNGPFEVYVRLTPRLNVVPDTDGAIGGGLGLRYYF
ncbi:hypothetical protein HQ496_03200 [bacterium]|nr:hypothetical protein [bacterium]